MDLKRYSLVLVWLLIIALGMMVAPVSAATWTINPGTSISAEISKVSSGDTIILNPGVYNQNTIFFSKNIIIEANTSPSAGGGPANTIIDGLGGTSGIFDGTGKYNLTIDNLSLMNGITTASGGAIDSDGTLTITSSTFTNCSAAEGGGAIDSDGTLTITSSTFTNCRATLSNAAGGAIESVPGSVTVTNSTFTDCSAAEGGAIFAGQSHIYINTSTFTDCSAPEGGAIGLAGSGTIQFSRLTGDGTAVYVEDGTLTATDNWWGTNANPSSFVSGTGTVSYSPWLVLGVTAFPSSITKSEKSTIQANFTYDSDGTYHNPVSGHVPDGTIVSYRPALIQVGMVSPTSAGTVSGISKATFTAHVTSDLALVWVLCDNQESYTTINITPEAATTSTTGVYRNGVFYLASSNTNGGGTINGFTFGTTGDVPIAGDWTGSGTDTVGVFRKGTFFLASNNTNGGGTINGFTFGTTGDVPVAGHWSGPGTDTVGVFRKGTFYLASSNTNGGGTVTGFTFGTTGDIPVVGDWTGSGTDTVGVFRKGTFYLASSNTNGGGTINGFTFGTTGDVPVVWNNNGVSTIGIFRNGVFYLASANQNGGGTISAYTFGTTGDVPVTGQWG